MTLPLAGCGNDADTSKSSSADASASSSSGGGVSPKAIDQSLAAAEQYLVGGQAVKAEAILRTLIEKEPDLLAARELYARTLMTKAGQATKEGIAEQATEARRKAYEQYQAALEIDPGSAGLHHAAGMLASLLGRSDAALEHFQRAAAIDPANPQYPLFAAQMLLQNEDYAAARRSLENVLAVDPNQPQALASLAVVYMEQGDFETAIKQITQARSHNRHDINLRVIEAKIYRRAGQPKRAVELLVGVGPEARASKAVAYELAESYTQLDRHAQAADVWTHRFNTHPDSPDAGQTAARIAEALIKSGERSKALTWIEQAQLLGGQPSEIERLRTMLAQ